MKMLVVIFLGIFCAFTNGGQWSGASRMSATKNLWQSNTASNSWSVPNNAPAFKYQGPVALPPGYDETGAPLPVKDTPEVDRAKALQLAAIAKAGGDIYPATGPDPWADYAAQSHSSGYGQQGARGSKKWKRSIEDSHHESPEQEELAKLAHEAAVNKAKAEIAEALHKQKQQIQNSWSIATYAPKYTGPQALPGGYDKNGAPLPVQDTYEVAEVKSKQLTALVKAGGDIFPAKHYPEIYRSTVDAWKSQNNDWPSSSSNAWQSQSTNDWPSSSSSNAWPSQSSNAWPSSSSSSNAWPSSSSSSNAWPSSSSSSKDWPSSSSSSNAWPSSSSSSNAWPSSSSNAWPSSSTSSNAWPSSSSSSNAWPSQSSSNAWPSSSSSSNAWPSSSTSSNAWPSSSSSSNAWPSQSSSNAWPSSSSSSNAWPSSSSSSNAWPSQSSSNAWPSASNNAWKIPSYAENAIRYHGPIALPPGYDINGAPLPVEDTPEVAALKYKHLQTQAKIAAERKQQWQPKW